MIVLKSAEEIQAMQRQEGGAQAHELVRELIRPGVTTLDLDRAVEEFYSGKTQFRLSKDTRVIPHQSVLRSTKWLCTDPAKTWSSKKDQ